MASRKKRKRLTVELPPNLGAALSRRLQSLQKQHPRAKTSDIDIVLDALHFVLGVGSAKRKAKSRESLLHQASSLKLQALAAQSQGITPKARACYILAAAREVEALVALDFSNSDAATEEALRSALVEIVFLLKSGTGYRSLPDVPLKRGMVKTSSV